MTQITDINQIDRSTPEGRLLWAALIELTKKLHSNKTPYQVIGKLNDIARQGDHEITDRNKLSAEQQKYKATAEENIKQHIMAFEQAAGRTVGSLDLMGVPSFVPTKPRALTSVRINLIQL